MTDAKIDRTEAAIREAMVIRLTRWLDSTPSQREQRRQWARERLHYQLHDSLAYRHRLPKVTRSGG